MTRRKFTPAQVKEIREAYLTGEAPAQIGKRYACGAEKIRRTLREQGVVLRGRSEASRQRARAKRVDFTADQVTEMAALKQRGLSLEAIGKRYGTSAPTVAKFLRSAGADTSRRAALNPEQKMEVIQRYRNGETMGSLAEVYGVSRQPIKKVLMEAGVHLRSLSESMKGKRAHNKHCFSAMELETIRRLWEEENFTADEISAQLGLQSYCSVCRVIKEQGYEKESPKQKRERRQCEERERFKALVEDGLLERAQDLHGEGHSFSEIAKILDVPLRLLRDELKRLGLSNFGASLPLSMRQELLQRYGRRRGDRIADLVREYGISTPPTVCKFLKSRGVDTTYSFNFNDEEWQRMRELYDQGMGTTEIAHLLSRERNEDIFDEVVRDALCRAGAVLVGYTAAVEYVSRYAGKIRLRGAWERDVAVYLDQHADRGEIRGWEYAKQRIPYVQKGKHRTYIPDFEVAHVNGEVEIWEVKGYLFSGTEAKLEAAKSAGYRVKVIDEEGIKEVWDEILDPWDWDWV